MLLVTHPPQSALLYSFTTEKSSINGPPGDHETPCVKQTLITSIVTEVVTRTSDPQVP